MVIEKLSKPFGEEAITFFLITWIFLFIKNKIWFYFPQSIFKPRFQLQMIFAKKTYNGR